MSLSLTRRGVWILSVAFLFSAVVPATAEAQLFRRLCRRRARRTTQTYVTPQRATCGSTYDACRVGSLGQVWAGNQCVSEFYDIENCKTGGNSVNEDTCNQPYDTMGCGSSAGNCSHCFNFSSGNQLVANGTDEMGAPVKYRLTPSLTQNFNIGQLRFVNVAGRATPIYVQFTNPHNPMQTRYADVRLVTLQNGQAPPRTIAIAIEVAQPSQVHHVDPNAATIANSNSRGVLLHYGIGPNNYTFPVLLLK